MKKISVLCACLSLAVILLSPAPARAQVACDPNDPLYADLTLWEENGLLPYLPPLRPYPQQLLVRLLEQVAEKGHEADKAKAEKYLAALGQPLPAIHLSLYNRSMTAGTDYGQESALQASFGGSFNPLFSFSGRIAAWSILDPGDNLLPRYTYTANDYHKDWASVDVAGHSIGVYQGLTAGGAFGTDKAYFQSGLMRSSFGPFFADGAVLNPSAPHAGHFSFTYRGKAFTFTALLLALTATDVDPTDDDPDDPGNMEFYPDKFLALHALTFNPRPWWELGVFETVIYGGRFDPLYLIPVSELTYSQGVMGLEDNSLVGASARFRLPSSLNLAFLFYLDDIHFNDLVRFDFKTKYKFALQAGLTWTPLGDLLKRLSLEYLAVMPYTYTHKSQSADDTEPNYLNYTHMGMNLGTTLEPNSDRIGLKALLEPWKDTELELFFKMIRHGNASEGIAGDTHYNDGSIFDDGYDDDGKANFQSETRFLTQSVIEHVFQSGFAIALRLPFYRGALSVGGGYTFEYILNKGLQKGENDVNHYLSLEVGYTF